MKALLLAAGHGTRLRGVTGTLPKILVPLGGRPLLDRQLEYLAGEGVTEVAVNLHHRADAVLAHLSERPAPIPVRLSVEDELLGTSGALRPLADFLDTTFAVLYGDVVTDLDLGDLVERHQAAAATATLACLPSLEVAGKGVLEVDDRLRVTRFVEKGDPGGGEHLVNAGVYVLEPRILEHVPEGRSDFGHDVWPEAIAAGVHLQAAPVDAYLEDVGTPEAHARAEAALRAGRVGGGARL